MKYLPVMQQEHCVEVKEVGGMATDEKAEISRYVDLAQLGEQCFEHVGGKLGELT